MVVRQTTRRFFFRCVIGFFLVLGFVGIYLHDSLSFSSAARTARYVTNDSSIEFAQVASFEAPPAEKVSRTSIKIDPFGEAYVSLDGSDIAVGDPGHVYSERSPIWVAARGDSRLYYAMAREGRLVVAQSYDGGRTFQSEQLIQNGFRNATPPVQGNLALRNASSGTKLYTVFVDALGTQIQLARC